MALQELVDNIHFVWINRLSQNLDPKLKYHSVKHTLSVLDSCVEIGIAEGISETEMHLLKIAAIFHDTGFLESPEQHEKRGVSFALDYLNNSQLSERQLDDIANMIMATKIPQRPHCHLCEILCDADLAYMGTGHYEVVSGLLREEIELLGQPLSEEKWLKIQIGFLESHTYFTKYAINHFSKVKKTHLEKLKKELLDLND
jgi:uncharacterized protein